jgi:hypothetical protein
MVILQLLIDRGASFRSAGFAKSSGATSVYGLPIASRLPSEDIIQLFGHLGVDGYPEFRGMPPIAREMLF